MAIKLPPAAQGRKACAAVGREGGGDFGDDLCEGQPVDPGRDEGFKGLPQVGGIRSGS